MPDVPADSHHGTPDGLGSKGYESHLTSAFRSCGVESQWHAFHRRPRPPHVRHPSKHESHRFQACGRRLFAPKISSNECACKTAGANLPGFESTSPCGRSGRRSGARDVLAFIVSTEERTAQPTADLPHQNQPCIAEKEIHARREVAENRSSIKPLSCWPQIFICNLLHRDSVADSVVGGWGNDVSCNQLVFILIRAVVYDGVRVVVADSGQPLQIFFC